MNWFKLKDEKLAVGTTWILIAVAYAFSVLFRIFKANYTSLENLKIKGEFINTPDGYFFAKGALDLVNAGKGIVSSGSPDSSLIAQTTAFFVKILPFSFETVVFFMPAFIGSLLVVPLIWIGRSIKQTYLGFLAALLGGVAYSYFIRTQAGYYDTDMLTVVLPTFVAAAIIAAINSKIKHFWIAITFFMALNQAWYPQAYAINSTFFIGIIGYTIVFDRKNLFNYQTAFFALLGLMGTPGLVVIPIVFKTILAIWIWALFHYREKIALKFFWYVFPLAALYNFSTMGLGPISGLLGMYVFNTTNTSHAQNASLQYYNVMSTIQEAGKITFSMFATRISGHPVTFALSCIGFFLSLLAYRTLLFTLPLLAVGALALSSGLRFTIYAVPALALGIAYLILLITKKIKPQMFRWVLALVILAVPLYYNYVKLKPVQYGGIFNEHEIKALANLADKISPQDYAISWWDYGHPFRFYLNATIPLDGGAHAGYNNFPVAYALTSDSQIASSNMLRIAMETHKHNPGTDFVQHYMKTMGEINPDNFLNELKKEDFPLPKKTTELYFVLPQRMIPLLNTIQLFSNLDLTTGNEKIRRYFYTTTRWTDSDDIIKLANGIIIDKKKRTIQLGNQQANLANIYITRYFEGRLGVKHSAAHSNGKLNVFVMIDYHRIIIADNILANSTLIKLFVLEHFDPRYFEPVLMSPLLKAYRLKR